jgi:DDE superfamily endonuclease
MMTLIALICKALFSSISTFETLPDHYQGKFRFHFLPAHCGHHLNPIEGFWRVMKDAIGAGRCFPDLHQLYHRTRQVLMAHQERPIYAFHW